MELSIRTRALEITDELRDWITRRLHLALDTFKDRIEHASVYIEDINGPKGGADKMCQITVRAAGAGEIVIRHTGVTIGSALNRAAGRLKYQLARAIRQTNRPSTESIRTAPASA